MGIGVIKAKSLGRLTQVSPRPNTHPPPASAPWKRGGAPRTLGRQFKMLKNAQLIGS